MTNLYYHTNNGEYISKSKVNDALNTLSKIINGGTLVTLTDDEIIYKGSKIDAIMAYRRKYDCGIAEAKQAIEYLRGETEV